jgi:hypothetical protein
MQYKHLGRSGLKVSRLALGTFRAAQATHEGHISAGGVEKDVRFAETDNEATNKAIDEQYLAKYGRYGARYVDPMVAAEARATTIKLVPARDGGGE